MIEILLLLLSMFVTPVHAQGCGPTNPNCVVPTAPAGTADNRAASTAFVSQSLFAQGWQEVAAVTPSVSGTVIYRQGFTVAGDGGASWYRWTTDPCLTSPSGDLGLDIRPFSGIGCWVAILGAEVDIRLWGNIGTTDDSQVWKNANVAFGQMSLPACTRACIKPALICPGPTVALNVRVDNTVEIRGNGFCTVTPPAGAGTTDFIFSYRGPGPWNLDNMDFVGTIYHFNDWTFVPPINKFVFSGSNTGSEQKNITIKNIRCTGGQACISLNGAENVNIENVWVDRSYNDAVGVGSSNGGNGDNRQTSSKIRITNVWCRGSGGFCVIGYSNDSTGKVAQHVIEYTNVFATLGGFIFGKQCFEPYGATTSVLVDAHARNCKSGGLEFKGSPASALSGSVPAIISGFDITMRYESNYDAGAGIWQSQGTSTSPAADNLNHRFNSYTVFFQAGAWQANTFYDVADTFMATCTLNSVASMCLYGVLDSGISDTVTQPNFTGGVGSCNWAATSVITNGGMTIVCMQDQTVPAGAAKYVAQTLTGAIILSGINTSARVTAQDVGVGVSLQPQNSTQTISNLTLYLDVTANISCLNDASTGDVTHPVGTIDHLWLITPRCRANRNDTNSGGNAAMLLGFCNATFVNNYTNMFISGGEIESIGVAGGASSSGAAFRDRTTTGTCAPAASIQMKIIGTRIAGSVGGIVIGAAFAGATWNVTMTGGTLELTTGAAGAPVSFTGATTVGSFTNLGSPIGVVNNNKANFGTWALTGGATTTVLGKFVAAPSTALPNWACNWGDVVPSATDGTNGIGDGEFRCGNPAGGATVRWYGGSQAVNTLPTCSARIDGASTFVNNNATAAAYLGAVTNGGAGRQRVVCNGTATAWQQE